MCVCVCVCVCVCTVIGGRYCCLLIPRFLAHVADVTVRLCRPASQEAIEDYRLNLAAEEAELDARFSNALLSSEPLPHWHHDHMVYVLTDTPTATGGASIGPVSLGAGDDDVGGTPCETPPSANAPAPLSGDPARAGTGSLRRTASARFQDARPPSLTLHSDIAGGDGDDGDGGDGGGGGGHGHGGERGSSRGWRILRSHVLAGATPDGGHASVVAQQQQQRAVIPSDQLTRVRELQIAVVMEVAVVMNAARAIARGVVDGSFGAVLATIRPVTVCEQFIDMAFDMVRGVLVGVWTCGYGVWTVWRVSMTGVRLSCRGTR